MRSWLQRVLARRPRRRPPVRCYLRENGPIAYEFELFASAPRDRIDAMMSSGLSWAWKSNPREWTHLTRISFSAFLSDLPGGVLLVGAEEDLPPDLSDASVGAWIRRFARLQPVPLVAVILVGPLQQLLFVPQHASAAINALFEEWGIDKKAAERTSYARLGAASLERIGEKLELGR